MLKEKINKLQHHIKYLQIYSTIDLGIFLFFVGVFIQKCQKETHYLLLSISNNIYFYLNQEIKC